MERDRLDNLLRQKLGNNQMTPPPDLWTKIEADLETCSVPKSSQGTEPKGSWRKIVLWRYVAAACLLLAIMANFYLRRQEQPLTAQHTEIQSPEQSEITTRQLPGEQVPTAQQSSGEPKDATPAKKTERHRMIAVLSADPASIPTTTLYSTEKASDRTDKITRSVTKIPIPAKDEGRPATREISSSPNQQAQHSKATPEEHSIQEPEWYRKVEKENGSARKQRKYRNISASLYTDNMTGGDYSSSGIGTPVNHSNSLSMMESVMLPSQDNILTYKQEPPKSTYRHRTPVTFGVNVSFQLSKRFALETGLIYTHLHSETETQGAFDYHIEQNLNYIGVPFSATYTLIGSRFIDLYLRGGATAEILASGRQEGRISKEQVGSSRTETTGVEAKGIQTSVGAAAGAMFNISRTLGLYIEPGISHYFENRDQPASYRTEHPTNFNLRVGIRISFQ